MRHKTDHIEGLLLDINDYFLVPDSKNPNGSFKRIFCHYGLEFSAQVGSHAYCEPRSARGPWQSVEIGFPSEEIPEFMPYAENADDPLETVYPYVPVSVVNKVLAKNGGINLYSSGVKGRRRNPEDYPDYTGGMLYGYGVNQMTPDPYDRTPNGPQSVLKTFEKDFDGRIANREKSGDWYVWDIVDMDGIHAIAGELKDAGFYSIFIKHGKLGALRTHFSSR